MNRIDMYQLIEAQHEKLEDFVERLIEDGKSLSPESARARVARLDDSVRKLLDAERRTLHAVLGAGGFGPSIYRLQAAMHPHILRLLEELRSLSPGARRWMSTLRELQDNLRYVFQEEERALFDESRRVLGHSDALRLARELEALQDRAASQGDADGGDRQHGDSDSR